MDQNVEPFAAGGFPAGFMLIYFAIAILTLVGFWKVFEKAGKPGWASIVPIYNLIILLEIVGKPTWWVILMLIPCVNLVFCVWVLNLLSKSFGQSEGFTVGLVVLFYVFFPILGLSKQYQYLGPSAAKAKGGNSLDPLIIRIRSIKVQGVPMPLVTRQTLQIQIIQIIQTGQLFNRCPR